MKSHAELREQMAASAQVASEPFAAGRAPHIDMVCR